MKVSELTIAECKAYCRAEDEEDAIFTILLAAGKAYIKGQTALTEEQMDQYEDLTAALLILCADLYENRAYQQSEVRVTPNLAVKAIIDQYQMHIL